MGRTWLAHAIVDMTSGHVTCPHYRCHLPFLLSPVTPLYVATTVPPDMATVAPTLTFSFD